MASLHLPASCDSARGHWMTAGVHSVNDYLAGFSPPSLVANASRAVRRYRPVVPANRIPSCALHDSFLTARIALSRVIPPRKTRRDRPPAMTLRARSSTGGKTDTVTRGKHTSRKRRSCLSTVAFTFAADIRIATSSSKASEVAMLQSSV
jgi:hypothetical protein